LHALAHGSSRRGESTYWHVYLSRPDIYCQARGSASRQKMALRMPLFTVSLTLWQKQSLSSRSDESRKPSTRDEQVVTRYRRSWELVHFPF
jgi:hypothetical protein